jgi:hypothetical protein
MELKDGDMALELARELPGNPFNGIERVLVPFLSTLS